MKLPYSNAQLKRDTKYSLEGCYGKVALLMLVYNVMLSFAQSIVDASEETTGFYLLLSILLWCGTVFMNLGLRYAMLTLSRDKIPEVSDLFAGGPVYVKELLLQLILSGIPSVISSIGNLFVGIYIAIGAWSLVITTTVLMLVGSVVWFVLTLQWCLAPYLLLDNTKMSVSALLRTSRMLMKRNCLRLLWLDLSLFGWLLLSLLPIVNLWTIPYIMITVCNFYNRTVRAYKDSLQQEQAPAEEPSAENIFTKE